MIPKAFNYLNDYIISVSWDAAGQTVSLSIGETADLDVLRWIKYINQQYEETQKSPFIDIEWNWVNLVLLDGQDKEVGTVKLKNVNIINHNCHMHRIRPNTLNLGIDMGPQFLTYNITLSYQEAEIIPPVQKEEAVESTDPNKLSDKEWQTVET